ncbi:hypothetical protein QB781_003888 [Salmonella enterica]|nr:hypothetical protein [Salmonella enterica subsp. enterica serovar Javiana]EHI7423294.1 hypothetical protein [Salmonella enterica]EIP6686931.1 hypothetical protein [Salmonella enterica subsp. enterica serovar Javiana]EIP6741540.1 hypothetical protein [Salmonella enterica subsp. enterica serovar Javiana]EIQ4669998.1 hypothetical protein [Salmonella enterica subsp. enterica serovar Javiana]
MTNRTISLKQTMILLFVLTTVSGCSSMEQIKKERSQYNNYYKLTPSVSKGDKLQYKLNTGEKGWFTVAAIKPDSLISKSGEEYFLTNIQSINRSKVSTVKTAAVGLGVTTIIISSVFLIGAIEVASAALSV